MIKINEDMSFSAQEQALQQIPMAQRNKAPTKTKDFMSEK